MYSSNSSQHHHSGRDFVTEIRNWWATCPLFTRFLLFFCSTICVLALLSNVGLLLVNIPAKTIGDFEITRLFYSPFTFFTISELLLGFIAYIPIISEQEKSQGTLKAALDFLVRSYELNISFIFACYFFSIIYSGFKEFACYGLWGVFFMHTIEKCLENLEGNVNFLGFPLHVKAKYYPIILLILFSVISNLFRFDIAVALFVGYLNHKFLNRFIEEILNDVRIASLEQTTFMLWIKTLPHFMGFGSQTRALMDSYDHGPRYKGQHQSHHDVEDLAADMEDQ